MSYAWHVAAYLYASADRFQLEDGTSAIKFVEMPTADLVKEKVKEGSQVPTNLNKSMTIRDYMRAYVG